MTSTRCAGKSAAAIVASTRRAGKSTVAIVALNSSATGLIMETVMLALQDGSLVKEFPNRFLSRPFHKLLHCIITNSTLTN